MLNKVTNCGYKDIFPSDSFAVNLDRLREHYFNLLILQILCKSHHIEFVYFLISRKICEIACAPTIWYVQHITY